MKRRASQEELSPQQRQALIDRIKTAHGYVMAHEDLEFLKKKDLRPVRLQLELLKPELILREHRIRSTIVVFGSARLRSRAKAREELAAVLADFGSRPDTPAGRQALRRARRALKLSKYYEEARRFAALAARNQPPNRQLEFVIATGGGPGAMEAANRGAFESGAKSVGFAITLPHEPDPNPYITPEITFRFHYFSLRKMHFLMRARALVAFPGGYGTFDELFETLTLVQTGKKRPIPIVLFGTDFWSKAVNFDYLLDQDMITQEDRRLFKIVESAEDGWEYIQNFWKEHRYALWK